MKLDGVEDIYELSPLQQGMLFHTLLKPKSATYFEQVGFPLFGPLNTAAFERAWQTVLDWHTILRTSYHWDKATKPLQVVHRSVKLPVEYLDWTSIPAETFQQLLDSFLIRDRERGFDLEEPPLLRLSVIAQPDGSKYIVLSLHHLLLDGWSSSLVCREAGALYTAYCRGDRIELAPSRPYGDYIAWLQQQDLSAAERYWRKRLAGYNSAPPLGIGLPPGPRHQDTDFDVCEALLNRGITDALRQIAAHHRLTLNTIAQGAWALLLSRYSGEEDIVFGATVSGRPVDLNSVESMVGLFINTLPVRARVPPEAELMNWLAELQAAQFEARQFEYTPLVQVHSWSDRGDSSLFETILAFENFPDSGGANDPTLEFRAFTQTNYPLTMCVLPGAEWKLKVLYAGSRFAADEAKRLLAHYEHLLGVIAKGSVRRLSGIDLLAEDEQSLFAASNDVQTDYPREITIQQLFEEQVLRNANRVAISFAGEYLTYDALNRHGNQLAYRLLEHCAGGDRVVGLCVESPIDFGIGMLAILKAGGAYLPLDPAYPDALLRFMLEDAEAVAVVTTGALSARAALEGRTLLALESACGTDQDHEDNPPCRTTAENLAYVMYTSGSTGRPKGVSIPHRAVIRTVRNTNYVDFRQPQVIAQISSLSFDAATFEFWGALLNGGRLAGIPRTAVLSPDRFAGSLHDESVTSVFVTTDLFNQLVRVRPGVFRSIDNVLVGGAPIDTKWISVCLRDGPPRRLVHVYGPTESTTFACWHLIAHAEASNRSIPIGAPISNTQAYVLDRYMCQLPVGLAGELFLGGDGLARGYLNRPDLTAEAFVPDPFSGQLAARLYRTGDRARRHADGAIEFLGRLDDQVKIRGFRVELGEIESALRSQPGISDAVVLAREDAPGSRRLVAYVVPASGTPAVPELRRTLEARLPEYMVPSAFVIRDALPLTQNGKIDRKALVASDERPAVEHAYVEPRTPEEKTLAGIWQSVLSVERVGIHDNFFELGGDSIISIQVIARAREAGLELTLGQLFQTQTVASLAAVAGTADRTRAEEGILEGDVPLTPIQHWFFEDQPHDADHFNHAVLLETPPGLIAAFLAQATEHMVLHHDALRLRFRQEAGHWRASYEPSVEPPAFRSVDLRGIGEEEASARISAECDETHRSLNLGSGPILQVVWFDLGERTGRLLVTIHHLAVDAVSWRILMQDFWDAYQCLTHGEPVALPAKTSSDRQWAQRLHEYAQSQKLTNDFQYWAVEASAGAGNIPLDFGGEEDVASAADTVSLELDEQTTLALVQEAPRAYGTQINDVLLTALAQALAAWMRAATVRFDLEGHGREPIFDDLDLTRTVGWFTTIFPVSVNVPAGEPGDVLRDIKEQLHRIPHHGLSYGVLRYLSPDAETTVRLTAIPPADVAFNYLGHVEAVPELESIGALRSPRMRRRHLIEINGEICGGRLRIHWEFSRNHHRRATIERVAADYMSRLEELIKHCRSPKQARFTPSDFAQAGINQKELDKLVAAVAQSQRQNG
jgi:amino acid adenylation domain-containing protein/non-ribosomal peptide synthase protein (TIGR01720 family)